MNSAGGKYENGSCQFTKIKNNDGVIYKFFDEDTIIEITVPKDLTVKKFPIDNPVIDPTVEIFAISRFPKSPNLQVRYLYQNEAEKEKKTEVLEKLLTLILDDSLQIESMEILELDSRKQFACKFENKIPIVSP